MQAVIMAGGAGTRLRELTRDEIPKPMALLAGKPLLEHQTDRLKEYGITDITFVTGHLGHKIREYFGDGTAFGLNTSYIEEKEPLGTAGAMAFLRESVHETFFLIFGDIYFDFDMDRMAAFHREKGAEVTLLAHPNMHPYDSDLIRADHEGRVTGFDSKKNIRDYWYDNLVNAGIYVMEPEVLKRVPEPVKTDLEKEVIAGMIEAGEAVYAYSTPEFVRDVGTVDRILRTEEDIRSGVTKARNLKNRQKAIFLDRDGTINVHKGFISRPEDFELIPGAAEAIRHINESGYLAILVSNQPVVARGECTEEELGNIMNKMKTLIGREGAYLDAVYYCPHHPDSGFPGEVKELKIDCDCRKPKTGMTDRAAAEYNIDLSQSWVIGDTTSDMEMARRAGCRKALLTGTGWKGTDGRYEVTTEIKADDLKCAVAEIMNKEK